MTPSDPDPIRIGNRYRLDERIGAGAMGAVWRGTDELLNRSVAVKELLAAAANGIAGNGADAIEESRQRILREGRIGARLQHAHVISMFDVVVHDERPWLIMEYLPSSSLAAVLTEKGPMDPADAAAIGQQVADGLAAAHAAGVVHRDIKPGNVLIAEDGRAKITDFGVSRAVDDVQLTRTGMIAGTPAFLAPEVARGQEPTPASDVFALGATLYAAVEGEPPFGLDDNPYALLHKVATGAVRPPQSAGPLTALLMRLLSNQPEDRPTASQTRDALVAIAAGRSAAGVAPPARTSPATVVAPAVAVDEEPADPGPRTLTEVPRPLVIPPGGGGGSGNGPAAAGKPRRRRLVPILIAVVVLLAVGGGIVIGVARANGTPSDGVAAPATSAPAAPVTTTTAASTTTTTPPTTTTTTTTTPPTTTSDSATAPANSRDAVAFVQNYYSLLPGNPDAAFALLSSSAQAQSGGISSYRGFYAGMNSVGVENARSMGDGRVGATIRFERKDGTTTREAYTFVVSTADNGDQILQSFGRA
ncbi:serine/threonine-protein kinase [Pseudonocardia sp. T1-2H]|uniref:serine/threonine-protein kinase n=1 Tax=Pseudonocardia sp. T1-2H TaxID=3128899 RepID=UPI003100C19C